MIAVKKIQKLSTKLIKDYGNNGEVFRVKSATITGTTAKKHNSYDENGVEVTLATGVDSNATLERLKFKYIAKQLRGKEKAPYSPNTELIRFTCISQDLAGVDFMKNKILKGDEFIGFDGIRYSIEETNHVGQMQDKEILLEFICSRV